MATILYHTLGICLSTKFFLNAQTSLNMHCKLKKLGQQDALYLLLARNSLKKSISFPTTACLRLSVQGRVSN